MDCVKHNGNWLSQSMCGLKKLNTQRGHLRFKSVGQQHTVLIDEITLFENWVNKFSIRILFILSILVWSSSWKQSLCQFKYVLVHTTIFYLLHNNVAVSSSTGWVSFAWFIRKFISFMVFSFLRTRAFFLLFPTQMAKALKRRFVIGTERQLKRELLRC